jgi:hypothetical protein
MYKHPLMERGATRFRDDEEQLKATRVEVAKKALLARNEEVARREKAEKLAQKLRQSGTIR